MQQFSAVPLGAAEQKLSPVFDLETGIVEGILIRGAKDYVYDHENGCFKVNRCEKWDPQSPCFGESALRLKKLKKKIINKEISITLLIHFSIPSATS